MFDPANFTGFHTWLSLIALATGFAVMLGLLDGRLRGGWTGTYLATAIATSATGFGFPFGGVLPSHVVGVISLALLLAAAFALYGRRLDGQWRRIYAITAMLGLYLLAFVALAQAFMKVPALRALAPTQSEPPFAIAQGVLLVAFGVLTFLASSRFAGARSAPA